MLVNIPEIFHYMFYINLKIFQCHIDPIFYGVFMGHEVVSVEVVVTPKDLVNIMSWAFLWFRHDGVHSLYFLS